MQQFSFADRTSLTTVASQDDEFVAAKRTWRSPRPQQEYRRMSEKRLNFSEWGGFASNVQD